MWKKVEKWDSMGKMRKLEKWKKSKIEIQLKTKIIVLTGILTSGRRGEIQPLGCKNLGGTPNP